MGVNVSYCHCSTQSGQSTPPFVGDEYFSESGSEVPQNHIYCFGDQLWDGENCGASYFGKTFPADDIIFHLSHAFFLAHIAPQFIFFFPRDKEGRKQTCCIGVSPFCISVMHKIFGKAIIYSL